MLSVMYPLDPDSPQAPLAFRDPADEYVPGREPGQHEMCIECGSEQFMVMADGTVQCGWRGCQKPLPHLRATLVKTGPR